MVIWGSMEEIRITWIRNNTWWVNDIFIISDTVKQVIKVTRIKIKRNEERCLPFKQICLEQTRSSCRRFLMEEIRKKQSYLRSGAKSGQRMLETTTRHLGFMKWKKNLLTLSYGRTLPSRWKIYKQELARWEIGKQQAFKVFGPKVWWISIPGYKNARPCAPKNCTRTVLIQKNLTKARVLEQVTIVRFLVYLLRWSF